MDTVKLLYLMDDMRYERSLTQEDFLYGIVSQRQYYRYLHGESEPPFEVILKLCNRLEFSIERLLVMFEEVETKENFLAQKYFNSIIRKEYKEAQLLRNQILKIDFLDESNRKFVKLGSTLLDFYSDNLTKIELVTRVREEINFNKLMDKKVLHDIELYMLGILMEYSESDREKILYKILSLFREDKILTFSNRLYQAQLYFWIIKNSGRLKAYNQVVELSDKGIDFSKREYSYYLLEHFYYYKFLALHRIHDESNMHDTLTQLTMFLRTFKPELLNEYKQKIFKDTGIQLKF